MRKLVVDTSYLNRPELERYLSLSRQNFIVITDFCSREIYKVGNADSLFKRMEIIKKFPSQVIVLKNHYRVCAMRGRVSGLHRRLIDKEATDEFPRFLKDLDSLAAGDRYKQAAVERYVARANLEFEKAVCDAEETIVALNELWAGHTTVELDQLREWNLSESLKSKMVANILYLASEIFKKHPSWSLPPSLQELPYTYVFRCAVSTYLYALDRIVNGVSPEISKKKIANDLVDMYQVAYGSLFNGVLSADKRLMRIESRVNDCLSAFDLHRN